MNHRQYHHPLHATHPLCKSRGTQVSSPQLSQCAIQVGGGQCHDKCQQYFGVDILQKHRSVQTIPIQPEPNTTVSNSIPEEVAQMPNPQKMISHHFGVQVGPSPTSYVSLRKDYGHMTHKKLLRQILSTRHNTLTWLREQKLLSDGFKCPTCHKDMVEEDTDRCSDGLRWICRDQSQESKHTRTITLRRGSWFSKSNLRFEEIIELTYWWTQRVKQKQLIKEVGCDRGTAVDWCSFCREVCEVFLMERCEKIGGPNKIVQIDESKFGKRKFHRGRRVEGQWVLGGIEHEGRGCFLVPVARRDRETLEPIIKKWVAPGSIIWTDCWKAYCRLSRCNFTHCTVNHKQQFITDDGVHTNKIEGHWRQAKRCLPDCGVRKYMMSSYLAEFIWRYINHGNDLFAQFIQDIKYIYPGSL